MHDLWMSISHNVMERVTGPLKFRMVLQPLMACIYAVIGGLRDAKTGARPYFWGLITDSSNRKAMIRDGWKSVGKIFIFAVIMDVAFQLYVQHSVRLVEAVIVAVILAIVPYLALRGLVTRIARKNRASPRNLRSDP